MKAIYPGTFDPPTMGHLDMVERTSHMFEEVIVAVVRQTSKHLMFSAEERVQMFSDALAHVPNVRVTGYDGLTVVFAKEQGAGVIVRGLRIGSDFEYEREMALLNRDIGNVETVCLLSSLEFQYVSSSRVKEIAALGADVSRLVPENVLAPLLDRLKGAASR
ncbi:MAG: pantetheine-phosphate adenylyltransferase [Chloroflexi bacterium]|nr:pantetheine-phosphate adenylyltransferase [Chloroflexota bacterium]